MRSMLTGTLLAALALSAGTSSPKPDTEMRNRISNVNKQILPHCGDERAAPPPTVSERISEAEWHALSGIQALTKAGKSGPDGLRHSPQFETEPGGCELVPR